MRILLTGGQGRLGSRLQERLSPHHNVTSTDIDTLDFTDSKQVQDWMAQVQPHLVIHAGAMTAVDDCARNPEEALRVNAWGTKQIVLACQKFDSALLYVSTNEVFAGDNTAYYREYDPTAPINPYGYSKWVGEQIIRDHLSRFYIARTSWLFAHGGRNFIQAILERAQKGENLRVVINEVSTPTYNDDLVLAILQLIATEQYGVYHLVNDGRASRWQFARQILDLAGYSSKDIEKITAADYPRPSTPPEYAVLKNEAAAELGITLRPWQDALAAFLHTEGLLA